MEHMYCSKEREDHIMTEAETQKSLADEKSWGHAIKSGRIDLGNIQVNIDFLVQTGLVAPNCQILELGCGSGNLAAFLNTMDIPVIASDIAQSAIDHARSLHPEIDFRVHSAEELPYADQSFDIVTSFDVLEHLPNVDQHLCEVSRVLKPNGYYLFQTPNKLSNSIFETLKCRSMAWKKYHPSLHFYGQLRRRLNRNNFSFQCTKMNTMNEFVIKKIRKIGLPSWPFSWIDFRHMPYRLQTNFYIIAQKTSN